VGSGGAWRAVVRIRGVERRVVARVRGAGRRGVAGPGGAWFDGGGRSLSLPVSLSLPLFISLTCRSLLFADMQPAGPSPVQVGLDPATAGPDPATVGPDLVTAGSLELDAAMWMRRWRAQLGSTMGLIGLAGAFFI
jgi:hypothetical protein